MNKREAKREAHRWVSAIIHGALGNGLLNELAEDPADEDRVRDAILEIARSHDDRGRRAAALTEEPTP